MQQVKSSPQKKGKTLPQNLREKLKQLVLKTPNQKATQIDSNTYLLKNCSQANAQIQSLFDMSFKTFLKFLQMVGCKVKQIKTEQNSSQKVYKIFLPSQKQSSDNKLIHQLMKNMHIKSEANMNNYDQMSIQVNIPRPELQLMNLQHQNELKDIFLKNFKYNVDCTNQFVDNCIYRILMARKQKKLSPCQVMQLLTELRDRLFDNQGQLQQYIQNFKQKIKRCGHQTAENNQDGENLQSSKQFTKKQQMENQHDAGNHRMKDQ